MNKQSNDCWLLGGVLVQLKQPPMKEIDFFISELVITLVICVV